MPRRSGWFVVAETPDGAHLAHPVDDQAQVLLVLSRLAPVVPTSSVWYLEWR